jgi:hypothetical protein
MQPTDANDRNKTGNLITSILRGGLSAVLSAGAAKIQGDDQPGQAEGGQPAKPPTDKLLVSALRGRILAALSAAVSLWVVVREFGAALHTAAPQGIDPAEADAIINHLSLVLDHGELFLLAIASLVTIGASLYSKFRSWAKGR